MSSELTESQRAYAQRCLEAWAEWSARLEVNGLGWNRRVNWISNHRRGTDPGSTPPIYNSDEQAMHTERCVLNLPQVLRAVVLAEYLNQGGRQKKAKECQCTPETFKKRLERAYAYIYPGLRSKR
ncbi:DNA-directed RNA polymerase specialized sigma24 family protein [Methylohalomonas lacus]|uniref:DNA-directed RNA polymerase specialized sigma24 family protein n=1 Tax=Methylohalomonas lacus TaxID=398773 RepID=A0AAE3HI83_9GAMM|nr:hypothetical protein [Methylohalomonas lacus]MCS3902805.1 DNA-directed RNA polymerase specialized sigma24 family protein [Methylohalomonas lacus]